MHYAKKKKSVKYRVCKIHEMDYATLLQECESLKHYREISWNPKVHLPLTFFPGTDPPIQTAGSAAQLVLHPPFLQLNMQAESDQFTLRRLPLSPTCSQQPLWPQHIPTVYYLSNKLCRC